MTSDAAILKNGERLEVDTLLLCTGYRFAFPFLSDECCPEVLHDGQVVDGLYLHLINSAFPTMSFIGIPEKICPFPLFDRQVRYVLAILGGLARLPSTEEMLENVRKEMEASAEAGEDPHNFHVLASAQWAYNDMLAERGAFEPLRPVVRTLYETLHDKRVKNLVGFRLQSYKIIDDQTYVEL